MNRYLWTLLAVSLAAPAFADHHGEAKDGKAAKGGMEDKLKEGPCKADLEKFCKDITPGEGRLKACLHAHSDKLSGDCKAKHDAMKRKGRAPRQKMRERRKERRGDDHGAKPAEGEKKAP